MCCPTPVTTICGLEKASLRKPTPSEIAGLFCDLNDDEMAEFFEAVAAYARTWNDPACNQWYYTGKHLVECDEACGEGAAIIEGMMDGIEAGRRKSEPTIARDELLCTP
jgi:hypothetical protein